MIKDLKEQEKWRGLGAWNVYFIFKFALLYAGYLNFHPLLNLAFMAFLLIPIGNRAGTVFRAAIAFPLGLALFYHDTWLPSAHSIFLLYDQVADFSVSYLLELFNRFINIRMLLIAFVIWVGYLFINQWVRVSTFVILSMIILMCLSVKWPATAAFMATQQSDIQHNVSFQKALVPPEGTLSENIERYISDFWGREEKKENPFARLSMKKSMPFDILFIHVCSLSLDDIRAVHLENHPVWKKFDITFDKFNSAASYSNPATLRLLRGSCGQAKFESLFAPTSPDCYLLKNISELGFKEQLLLDHSGAYGNMLNDLKAQGGLSEVPLMPQLDIPLQMKSFYGGKIFSDKIILDRWMKGLKGSSRTVTFFNTIALHDGNRVLKSNSLVPYEHAVKNLLDLVDDLFEKLNASGKKTMIIFMGAHGRNYSGDAVQVSGLRDIPSPEITQVPVGIKLTGFSPDDNTFNQTIHIKKPSSFYALSELIAWIINGNLFEKGTASSLTTLANQLSITPLVSQNQGASVINYANKVYIKLRNEFEWIPLPKHRITRSF